MLQTVIFTIILMTINRKFIFTVASFFIFGVFLGFSTTYFHSIKTCSLKKNFTSSQQISNVYLNSLVGILDGDSGEDDLREIVAFSLKNDMDLETMIYFLIEYYQNNINPVDFDDVLCNVASRNWLDVYHPNCRLQRDEPKRSKVHVEPYVMELIEYPWAERDSLGTGSVKIKNENIR